MITTAHTRSPFPVYVETPNSDPDELSILDPESHVIRAKLAIDGKFKYTLHCQFIICSECPYISANTSDAPSACRQSLIDDAIEDCPEIFC